MIFSTFALVSFSALGVGANRRLLKGGVYPALGGEWGAARGQVGGRGQRGAGRMQAGWAQVHSPRGARGGGRRRAGCPSAGAHALMA